MDLIEIRDLRKSFGEVRAVDGISFSVREGEMFAFLGLNGAGKSTTIAILCGTLDRDGGEVLMNDRPVEEAAEAVKATLGVVFQSSVLDKPLSVLENLRSRAALYGITGQAFSKRLTELCKLLDLTPLLKRPVGKLSGGQRRRVDIARALLHRPRLLILDEPTTALDPQTRRDVWRILNTLRREEAMTVFFTTHYMEEAATADHVVILDGGKIAAEGTPLTLKNRYAGDRLSLYGIQEEDALSLGFPYTAIPDGYRFTLPNTAAATALIQSRPSLFIDYEITKGNMDDVFLAVTGKSLSGGEAK